MTDRRTRLLAAALLGGALLVGAGAVAGEPPELAMVRGLPAGDTLTVRAEPTAQARAIGALAEGAGPIEILEAARTGQTEWARISSGEGDGWVARRYLAEARLEGIGRTSLTVGLSCGGTEPFWGLDLTAADRAEWRDPEIGAPEPVAIDQAFAAVARGGWPAALTLSSDRLEAVLTATPNECSDGMSDRSYPWTALLVDLTGEKPRLFEGCCGHRPVFAHR